MRENRELMVRRNGSQSVNMVVTARTRIHVNSTTQENVDLAAIA